jgi:hypothetical protein
MSIFGKIKDAILGKDRFSKSDDDRPAPAPAPTIDTTQPPGAGTVTATNVPTASARGGAAAAPLIDVENHLDSMSGADNLNWRTSIVDLMKLIGIDSDYESRKALAEEMGRSDYTGSAEDNVWLHRQVMAGLARSGGRVPAEFLD